MHKRNWGVSQSFCFGETRKIMRKNNWKVLGISTLAAIAATICLPLSGQATNSTILEEKPLAGITLSLDHYCEVVMKEAKADAQQEQAKADKQVIAGGTTIDSAESSKKSTTTKYKLKYKNLGIANVDTYLNVRKKASESSKVVGKMTRNSGCEILSKKKGWYRVESGKVRGYVKAKYLLTGTKAQEKASKAARLIAVVKTQTLNVRYLPSTDARIYDLIAEGEDYTVERENLSVEYMKKYVSKHCSKKDRKGVDMKAMYDDLENWVMLSIDNEKVFVSKDFISMKYRLRHAVTIKEANKKDSSSKGSSIVDYAMQFLGNRYVWGGTSLTNGTDCSGFTMSIYRHFGYSLPRTSRAQAAATRTVSSGDVQVGDLFFYGSGSVNHVALYIGNGQVIHASNARDGIKISNAYYRSPIKIGRVM